MPIDPDGISRDVVMCVKDGLINRVHDALKHSGLSVHCRVCTATISLPSMRTDCPVCKMTVQTGPELPMDKEELKKFILSVVQEGLETGNLKQAVEEISFLQVQRNALVALSHSSQQEQQPG